VIRFDGYTIFHTTRLADISGGGPYDLGNGRIINHDTILVLYRVLSRTTQDNQDVIAVSVNLLTGVQRVIPSISPGNLYYTYKSSNELLMEMKRTVAEYNGNPAVCVAVGGAGKLHKFIVFNEDMSKVVFCKRYSPYSKDTNVYTKSYTLENVECEQLLYPAHLCLHNQWMYPAMDGSVPAIKDSFSSERERFVILVSYFVFNNLLFMLLIY
jgi:hypothetical protein